MACLHICPFVKREGRPRVNVLSRAGKPATQLSFNVILQRQRNMKGFRAASWILWALLLSYSALHLVLISQPSTKTIQDRNQGASHEQYGKALSQHNNSTLIKTRKALLPIYGYNTLIYSALLITAITATTIQRRKGQQYNKSL